MNPISAMPYPLFRCFPRALFTGLLLLPLISSAQLETGLWKSRAKGPAAELEVFFPKPTHTSGSPELLVVPLLNSRLQLLPEGWLLVWVGRTDGTALANASVTIRVPDSGNALVNGSARTTEVTVQTDANGIARVRLTAPDVPSDGNGGGGGGPPVLS